MNCHIIGDKTIQGLKSCSYYTVTEIHSTLSGFLKDYINIKETDVLIYSFGYRDINLRESNEGLLEMYLKLPRGRKFTYIILPHNADLDLCDMIDEIHDNVRCISFLYDNFDHERSIRMEKLNDCILDLLEVKA